MNFPPEYRKTNVLKVLIIDNFLKRKKTRFMNILTFKTCVSDRHKLVGRMLRSTFTKGKPKKNFLPLLRKL